MKILVTAFEPFGGGSLNSAGETLRFVPEEISGARIVKLILPVVFGRSVELLCDVVRNEHPDAVLCLGQAGGRNALTPERIAINLEDAKLPDNAGQQPVDEPIDPGGPDAYFSTLPVKAMAEAIRNAGLPAEVSNTAGTYVCNQTMYGLLRFLAREAPSVRGGFMHLPFLTEQTAEAPDQPGMDRSDLTKGVTAALEAIISALSENK